MFSKINLWGVQRPEERGFAEYRRPLSNPEGRESVQPLQIDFESPIFCVWFSKELKRFVREWARGQVGQIHWDSLENHTQIPFYLIFIDPNGYWPTWIFSILGNQLSGSTARRVIEGWGDLPQGTFQIRIPAGFNQERYRLYVGNYAGIPIIILLSGRRDKNRRPFRQSQFCVVVHSIAKLCLHFIAWTARRFWKHWRKIPKLENATVAGS